MEAVGANGVAEIYRDMERFVRQNLCETEDQSRQRFEAWLRQDYERRRRRFNKSIWRDHTTGEYGDREDETAWKAWQASQTFTEA